MKKIFSIGLVAALLAITIWWYREQTVAPPAQISPVPQRTIETRLVAFGDSLTAGYGLPLDQSYPALLEQALLTKGYEVEVINSGVSGETSAGGVRRAEFIRSLDGDIVLFGLGGNDALRFLPPEELEKNLMAALSTLLQAPDAPRVVLLGMRAPGNASPEYRQAFDAVYPRLAAKYGLPLVPFFLEGVALDPQYTQNDGIHPNLLGYEYIVNNTLIPVVEKMLLDTLSLEKKVTPVVE